MAPCRRFPWVLDWGGETNVEKDDEAYEAAMAEFFALITPTFVLQPGERLPTREELYDRPCSGTRTLQG